jgi:activator of 2-hydroxyglutaryl-CoA dehydratase
MITAVGLDLGSQKTMVVMEDGEIVRTDTGIDKCFRKFRSLLNNFFI